MLAAVPGAWEGGKPLTFTYQWRQCDAAGADCTAISGATARVVPAGQRRRGALAQGLRDRDVRGGNRGRHVGPDRGRLPGGHPAGRPPDQPQAAADPRHGPGRADPDELGRDVDGVADEVHISLASLPRRRRLLHRDPARGRAAPDPHPRRHRLDALARRDRDRQGRRRVCDHRGDRRRGGRAAAAGLDRDPDGAPRDRGQPPDRGRARDCHLAARRGAGGEDRLADHLRRRSRGAGERGLSLRVRALLEGIPLAARPGVRTAAADADGARLLDGREGLSLRPAAPARAAPARHGRRLVRRPEQADSRADADTVPRLPVQAARLGRSHLHLAARPGARDRSPTSRPSPTPRTGASCCSRDSRCIPRPGSRGR